MVSLHEKYCGGVTREIHQITHSMNFQIDH
jgi:hypothetical protein